MARIKLYHLYPDHLNLYGDRGNIIALCRRAEWHNIEIEVIPVKPGDKMDFSHCDLLFMGGGQDSDQQMVAEDLKKRSSELRSAVEDGMVIFAVCGSYQLLGLYYITGSGEKIGGLELVNLYTVAETERLIGNAVIKCSLWSPAKTLVGFENHAGKTYLGPGLQPLGQIMIGHGNNGTDKTEGALYKNVIGTYLHGSLLPKNPWLTDFLLEKALAYRGKDFIPANLDDSLEKQAHDAFIKLAGSKKHKRMAARA